MEDGEVIYQDMFWKSPQTFLELMHKEMRDFITLRDLTNSLVRVKIILQGDKLRAYCEGCKSEDCIHTYFALDIALRRIVRRALEVEEVNHRRVMRRYKRLTFEDKIQILWGLGIDTKDLEEYINRIGRKNAKEISLWKDMMGAKKRFLF